MNLNQDASGVDIDPLERSAILLLSMGAENAAKVIRHLSRDEINILIPKMASLAGVSVNETKWTLQRFYQKFKEKSGIGHASRQYLETALDLSIGRSLSRNLLDGIFGDVISHDLQQLQWISPDVLARFFRQEHPQMQAVLLTFLPPDVSAATLAEFPEVQHEDILYRIANLQNISEHVLDELRFTVSRCLEYVAELSGVKVDGSKQVANVLNRYPGDKERMLTSLREQNHALAMEVEKNMYDFMALARQTDETLQTLIQEIQGDLLALAMKNTDAMFRKKILSALPKRMAQALEAQIQAGSATRSKIDGARDEVMLQVREMVTRGEIEFRLFDEPAM